MNELPLEARPRRGHFDGPLLFSEASEPEGSDPGEQGEVQSDGRSRPRDRRHQHQVGHRGKQGNLESRLGRAEVFRLPSSELNQTANSVLDHDSLAV